MLKSYFYSILILVICKIGHVLSAGVTFNISTTPSRIELDCTYTFGKGEKHTSTSYTKDGKTFVEYAAGQDKNPTFTSIPGISLVFLHGGCRVTILNYQNPESMGLYEIKLKYTDKQGKPTLRKKRYKLSLKVEKCKESWVNATKGEEVPDAFVAAFKHEQVLLYGCRTQGRRDVGFYDSARGCVYTNTKKVEVGETSEVLTGSGYSWVTQDDIKKVPDNALVIGKDPLGNIYLGRCNYQGTAFIGKITGDGFWFNYPADAESGDCKTHDILLCVK